MTPIRTTEAYKHLSTRLKYVLYLTEIDTVEQLAGFTKKELLKFRSIGKKSIAEIENFLLEFGMKLAEDTLNTPEKRAVKELKKWIDESHAHLSERLDYARGYKDGITQAKIIVETILCEAGC